MGKAIIDEETLTGIADAIRTRKGTSYLIPTPNMKNEILSISGEMPSLSNGYVVNFHGYDGEVMEIHSAKVGNAIGEPLSFVPRLWTDSNENEIVFPILSNTVGEVIDVYALHKDMADMIYRYYGIDKTIYPYLYISSWYNSSKNWRIKPIFCQSVDNETGVLTGVLGIQEATNKALTTDEYNNTAYYDDINTIFNYMKESNIVFDNSYDSYQSDNLTDKCRYYTNWDATFYTNWSDLRTL